MTPKQLRDRFVFIRFTKGKSYKKTGKKTRIVPEHGGKVRNKMHKKYTNCVHCVIKSVIGHSQPLSIELSKTGILIVSKTGATK
jgi:hypothetical protein